MTTTSLMIFDFDGIHIPRAASLTRRPRTGPWISEYRRLYAQQHNQSLIRAFPGADQVLSSLRQRKIPVAIVRSKGVQAVHAALRNNGLNGYVLEDLIVGDETPGATRKPDVGSFTDVLVPKMREAGLADAVLDASKVVVAGDRVADIQFARNIGARACWAQYGYGERFKYEELRPDITIEKLMDVITII
ncbi:hypothetical protein COL940_010789 [Colletotrichum noveboracense]|nr:hypothetical protein COL940_010789 [Colletotrichum noveboracense]KAJ0273640.1 hypothetical protein CBS470a_012147 [Colletotrichum nupharicola]